MFTTCGLSVLGLFARSQPCLAANASFVRSSCTGSAVPSIMVTSRSCPTPTRTRPPRLGQANAFRDLGIVRRLTGDFPAAAHALEQALDIPVTSATVVARPRRSTREGRCTGSAVTSRRLRGVTSRPWNWPAPSPAPGTSRTHWQAWAGAPLPSAARTTRKAGCSRRWRSSSGSGRPRPPTFPPNSKRSPMRDRPRTDHDFRDGPGQAGTGPSKEVPRA